MPSGVVIGLRTQKTHDNPEGYTIVDQIPPDQVCVVYFGGSGAETNEAANGYAKVVKNQIVSLLSQDIPVYGVTYQFDPNSNMGNDDNKFPKQLMYAKYHMWANLKEAAEFKQKATKEDHDPEYVNQLFQKIMLNRISENGKRLATEEACARIRKINIVAHCHGGYVALKLEEKMQEAMQEFKYTPEERKQIQSQLLVVAHAPECPLGVSKSQFISFFSVYDEKVFQAKNWMQKYLRMKEVEEKKRLRAENMGDPRANRYFKLFLRPSFFPGKQGNFFLIKNKLFESEFSAERGVDIIGEHEDIYYESLDTRTIEGDLMASLARNILVNGIKNSLSQQNGFKSLPTIDNLVLGQDLNQQQQEKKAFLEMQESGAAFLHQLREKHAKYSGLRGR